MLEAPDADLVRMSSQPLSLVGPKRTWTDVRLESVVRTKADSANYCGMVHSVGQPRIGGDLPDGQINWNRVQPFPQKYIASPFARNTFSDSSHPASNRGAYRDRHERWVRDAVDAAVSQDERF